MIKILVNWLLATLAVIVTAYLLNKGIAVSGFIPALVVALVLGLINAVLKPILIILTLPINILTLGLFTLVINALLVLLTSHIVPGFYVKGFWWAMGFAIILSIINALLGRPLKST